MRERIPARAHLAKAVCFVIALSLSLFSFVVVPFFSLSLVVPCCGRCTTDITHKVRLLCVTMTVVVNHDTTQHQHHQQQPRHAKPPPKTGSRRWLFVVAAVTTLVVFLGRQVKISVSVTWNEPPTNVYRSLHHNNNREEEDSDRFAMPAAAATSTNDRTLTDASQSDTRQEANHPSRTTADATQQQQDNTANTNAPPPPPENNKRNIVFILIDDLGVRDLACYRPEEHNNRTFYETPHIDALAAGSVLFANAYGAAPTCSLSRAGIYTGMAPSRLGMFHRSLPRHRYTAESKCFRKYNARTLPLHCCSTPLGTAFAQAGYRTGFVGKWHNAGTPADAGFVDRQTLYNHAGHLNTHFAPYQCDDTARDTTYCSHKSRLVQTPHMDSPVPDGTYATDHLTLEAIHTLRNFTAKEDKPFLLVLSHYAVHYPMEAKDVYEQEFQAKKKDMGLPNYQGTYERQIFTRTLQSNPTYAGMLKSVDDSVGAIVQELQSLGIQDETFIVLTSDNGGLASHELHKLYPPTSNMPYDLGKVYLGEGGIRVPLLISGPGLPSGRTSTYQSIGTDIYPTLLDLAQIPLRPADHVDGRSLLPAMRDNSLERNDPMFWQADYEWFWGNKTEYPTAIVWGDWKLVERYPPFSLASHSSAPPAINLYNIQQDPGETTDLFVTHKCQVERLHGRLQQWRAEWFNTSYFEKASAQYKCQATLANTRVLMTVSNMSACTNEIV